MKLVFLAVNSSYSHTNLAAWYLKSFTASLGWQWTTIELIAGQDVHATLDRITGLKPDVLAASFYLFNRSTVLSVLRRYRVLDPCCRILAGGPEFLGNNRSFFQREQCVDAAVRGEGEMAFRQILADIDRPDRWRRIPGFCGMIDGEYVDNGMADNVADLDDIPSPFASLDSRNSSADAIPQLRDVPPLRNSFQSNALSLMEGPAPSRPVREEQKKKILRPAGAGNKPFIQIETSRGCRNRCAFCTSGGYGAQVNVPPSPQPSPGGRGSYFLSSHHSPVSLREKTSIHSPLPLQEKTSIHDPLSYREESLIHNPLSCRDESLVHSPVSLREKSSIHNPLSLRERARVRVFSHDRIRSDLKAIHRARIKNVRIVDRTFNENGKRAIRLMRMFKTEFGNMSFHIEVHPALVGAALMKEFATARPGQFHLDAGVQTFSNRALKRVRRSGGSIATFKGMKLLCDCENIAVHADLMAGLPGASLAQTVADIRKLIKLRPAEIQLELLKLLPGTQLRYNSAKFGIVASPEPPYEVLRTKAMTAADIHAARWLCKLVDWFYAPEALRATVCRASDCLPEFWPDLVEFCLAKPGLWTMPSLENRFRLMDEFLATRSAFRTPDRNTKRKKASRRAHRDRRGKDIVRLRQRLRYDWMKYGFNPTDGICEAKPWTGPLPGNAVLLEGNTEAEVKREFAVDLDRRYIFRYGRRDVDRKAVAVFAIRIPRR